VASCPRPVFSAPPTNTPPPTSCPRAENCPQILLLQPAYEETDFLTPILFLPLRALWRGRRPSLVLPEKLFFSFLFFPTAPGRQTDSMFSGRDHELIPLIPSSSLAERAVLERDRTAQSPFDLIARSSMLPLQPLTAPPKGDILGMLKSLIEVDVWI